MEAFDAHVMADDWTATDPDLELEGSHLGRGKGYYDETGKDFVFLPVMITCSCK